MTYIVTGPYGSGKTEFCVNLAKMLAQDKDKKVVIADLDTINPYFRSREKVEDLKNHGIQVMGDHLDNNTGQDLPAVSFAFLSAINRGDHLIIDLGGGKFGINLLAACYESLQDYEFLCVLNAFRPETSDAEKMVTFVQSINAACKINVTGLVSNGHLLHSTAATDVLASQKEVVTAAEKLRLPLSYMLVKNEIYGQIKAEIKAEKVLTFDQLQMRQDWL